MKRPLLPAAPGLATARLRLRPLAPADADALFAIFSDPEVMRYWSAPAWSSVGQAQAMLRSDEQALQEGSALRLGVVLGTSGALVGTASLHHLHPQCRRAEVGYTLAREAWGQGYAVEAMAAVVAHAFEAVGLHRLEADIDPRNEASARVLQRLGFAHEGTLRERWIVGDEVSDSALYGLLASEWRAAQSPAVAPPARKADR